MKLVNKLKIIAALTLNILVMGMYAQVNADTGLIRNLDIKDVWRYNFNASHWIEQGNIQAGKSMYGDVNVPIKSLSKQLSGADWIQTAYGSKSFTGSTIANFTITQDAEVYIVHAKAVSIKPSWLKWYAKTAYTLQSANEAIFEVYSRKYRKGDTVKLGANGNTQQPMYLVLVKALGAIPVKTIPKGKIFDIFNYGAIGDGKTMNTKALQLAIDACTAAGGGSVYIHDGVFMTGTIVVKNNVILYVEAGAILRGSQNIKDYAAHQPLLPAYRSNEVYQLIYAEKEKNITITGGGIIDGYSLGEGLPWSNKLNETGRPRLIRMSECADIKITHITLIRSACWTEYYEGCENLKVNDVHVRCYTGQDNEDGIDISGCTNVEVSNFYAITGDDAVCVKSMSMKKTENLNIHDVLVRYSNCHVLKIGTETHALIKHVRVDRIIGSARFGVGIQSVDGAAVEDIVYDHITLQNCGVPILIRLGQRGRIFNGGPEKAPLSSMKNIIVRNLTNTDIGYDDYKSGPGIGSVISGLPGQEIENLTIENCNFLYYGSLKDSSLVTRQVPENPTLYPEFNLLGICPAYGLFTRHVKGLTYRNINIRCKYIDIRPAIVMDDVKGYTLTAIKADSSPLTLPFTIWHKQDGQLFPLFSTDRK